MLHQIERQRELRDGLLGGRDLGRGHLREVLLLQHLAVGDGEPRVDLDLALVLALLGAGKQRVLDALRARLRRLRRDRRRVGQHGGDDLLDQPALAEEDAEGLVEQNRVLVPLHEHGMQRPVEVVAIADARHLQGFQRIEHRAGPDRHAGRAQRTREVEDVLGEAAFTHATHLPFVPAKAGARAGFPSQGGL